MNYETLREYELQDIAESRQYDKALREGRFTDHPSKLRFRNLTRPVGVRSEAGSIWAQIPFFGSLLITIYAVDKSHFSRVHGFETRDLARLIDFSKDTGRVQFILNSSPTLYAGFDYLDELFKELKPPYRMRGGVTSLATWKRFKEVKAEFYTMAEGPYHHFMATAFRGMGWYGYTGGQKTKRDFKAGDFVMGEAGVCEKCQGKKTITSIYGEKPPQTSGQQRGTKRRLDRSLNSNSPSS